MQKYFKELIIRLLLCFVPISVFSLIFTPLTIYGSYFISKLFFNITLNGNVLFVNGFPFRIIEACVASAAYYFLWLLCFLTKDIKWAVRGKIIIYGFGLIFLMNIFRIWLLIFIAMNFGFRWFNVVHLAFWNFVTGVYVAFVWIFLVWHFKIIDIPIYSDIKHIYRLGFRKSRRPARPKHPL